MQELFKKFDIEPNNINLYNQAFTHTSYAYEHTGEESYEKLEFLGDAIVDTVVSDYLYNCNLYTEGEMTKIRASYVCENALSKYSEDLDFSKYIKVGKGENHTGGTHKKAIMADVFEAFMAAIYLDLGYEKVKDIALKIIIPYIENPDIMLFNDYKSALQEAVQTDKTSLEYIVLKESGPAHNKFFEVEVRVGDIVMGKGNGRSKKEAEQEAAKKALSTLSK